MATPTKYPPQPSPVTDSGSRLITRPWLLFFQSLVTQAAGAGDVVGPASSKANQIALFADTTGTLLTGATGSGVVHATAGVYSVSDVTLAEIVPASAASRLIGRQSGSAGDWQEISLGAGLTMTGTTLDSTGGSVQEALTVAWMGL